LARSSSIHAGPLPPARYTETLGNNSQLGARKSAALFLLFAGLLIASHGSLLRLPYFWDEAGYYIPAARDLYSGSLIPYSTPSNAHPPLVLAWIALVWRIFGQSILVTRCAMLLMAAFSLLGFFRMARAVANSTVAAWSTVLTAIYPVFFAQSSLAQVDLASAGLIFWGVESHFRGKRAAPIAWFSLAALAKETAILAPVALAVWHVFCALRKKEPVAKRTSVAKAERERQSGIGTSGSRALPDFYSPLFLLVSIVPLVLWYAYHYFRTGHVFGNPEFFRYNVQATLHPLRMVLALLLRLWQLTGYLSLYVLTLPCVIAMKFKPLSQSDRVRPRIEVSVQLNFLAMAIVYVICLSVIGGAVLARYLLPVTPLVILVCVSTIWRRLRPWKAGLVIVGLAFFSALLVNPPYGFAPEDNLAYRDYVQMHQLAAQFLQARYPNARVLTAWPASDELTHPYLGYVRSPMQVVRIDDFSMEQIESAQDQRSRFDAALMFSTKYQPQASIFDRWRAWQKWKSRYFGYHVDLTPQAAASLLDGGVAYYERRNGQWVGVLEMAKVENIEQAGSSREQMAGVGFHNQPNFASRH
jgi:4-amino-4-deoxy-L-arabinose transferase-like glycosyltransferase